ncbi:RusA family crossover junction endodeoxyribonuclease [Aquitalea magnusonii]|uniref:Crossover junction endodeoxyribonuclease RusA n=1 Tax=Aquitalea magnusonii TaxID=332411 RepID=A0A318J532_9NEIS|nr:RusA family crossover junction endodeoxyribonuclease [Aquitalea magnusonii]PXX42231.1 crossover junction endodeoxyribonuclease RusA [Aquitalea magnusonii]
MKSITLVLPYPVSANRYWRTYQPKGFKAPVTTLSAEAKAYKKLVAGIIHRAGIRQPFDGRVAVDIALYPNRPQDWARRAKKDPECWDDDVQCIDLDNANKVLLDSLKGLVFHDDKWVRKLFGERMEPDGDARVVVTITQLVPERAQQGLFAA